ncbi:MAG: terminase [Akkermansia sp.]
MNPEVLKILQTSQDRNSDIKRTFNPITGEGSILPRRTLDIPDYPIPRQWLPEAMFHIPLVREISRQGSIAAFLQTIQPPDTTPEQAEANRVKVIEQLTRVRCRHDFCFWAATMVFIKRKGGGEDMRFTLNRPQRTLITRFEQRRLQNKPIRLVLLKARQWGGSTATQIYFAWLQLMHKTGLNSLIVAQVKDTSNEILDMFDRMLKQYPAYMLTQPGQQPTDTQPVWVGVGNSGNIHRIPPRNCKVKIGTAEKPDSARGGDYNLLHFSEVAIWKKTEGKTPEDIIRSASSGVLLIPYTAIVYESTANGTGNFFQREYDAAKNGLSQFESLFIAWYDIEQYAQPFPTEADRQQFAADIYNNRNNKYPSSEREEPGQYLWWLFQKGATLEAINWYISERRKYADHGDMASEYPSDDEEAFVHSGARVFDKHKVELLRKACKPPKYIGDICADSDTGEKALTNLRFTDDTQGLLCIWNMPDTDPAETITDRYLTVVDVGGRSKKSDYSVIVVIDRLYMADGDKPEVVAQWYGHIDIDLLAWKAAQVAAFYDDSLLVIESNTLETHDRERQVEGDQSQYILNQIKAVYPNLYARKQSEEEINEGFPRKYGFHTNVATKPMIISNLVKVIRESLYIERDCRCLDEYITYERKQNGSYGAIIGKHDDLLMTRAIALHICFNEMDLPQIRQRKQRRQKQKRRQITAATI